MDTCGLRAGESIIASTPIRDSNVEISDETDPEDIKLELYVPGVSSSPFRVITLVYVLPPG